MNRFDFQCRGRHFRAQFDRDPDPLPPWGRYREQHGVISQWVNRRKHSHEWILSDLGSGWRLLYDTAASMQKAKRERWPLDPQVLEIFEHQYERTPTRNEIQAIAVRQDFERLQRWCAGAWWYVILRVSLIDATGSPVGPQAERPGLATDQGDVLAAVAREMAIKILS